MLHPELRNCAALHRMDLPRRYHVRMPEFCAPALGNRPERRHDRRRDPGQGQRRAVRAGRLLRRPEPVRRRTACSPTSTTCSSFSARHIRAKEKLPPGKAKIEVETRLCRTPARRPAEGDDQGERQGRGRRRRARQRAARCSPPTTALTSASTLARRYRWITTTRRRSSSTGQSSRSMCDIWWRRRGQAKWSLHVGRSWPSRFHRSPL